MRRDELAKDILCAMIQREICGFYPKESKRFEEMAESAVHLADSLRKALKEIPDPEMPNAQENQQEL